MEITDIQRCVSPLRLIFWGSIICVVDLSIDGFDIANDVIGIVMITCGVFSLSNLRVNDRYAAAMTYVKIIAVISIFTTLLNQFHYNDMPNFFSVLLQLLGLAKMIAIVVFCVAMGWLCKAASLEKSQQSWKVTTTLFTAIYLIPLGLLHIVGIAAGITGKSFNYNLRPDAISIFFIIVIFLIFFIPLIHLFVSTSRMKTEALLYGNVNEEYETFGGTEEDSSENDW